MQQQQIESTAEYGFCPDEGSQARLETWCRVVQLCLEDHCVAANFGNWSYFAGTGGDPKNRHLEQSANVLVNTK
ncbi:hypothetical protein QTG54_004058 [Skeletonema marinoi]|uniref:Uncharacterized protein n=1 Tax=Skeletonema marinoi TaxID=267567 RepID=A0AAD8YEL3_9STRA|nr:hypothetical protein QTG54_004058 [Skeletonema marinoi]